MTKECALIDGIIYCQCGDQSSHYGTMGKRGAREVRCEAPPQRSSKEMAKQLRDNAAVLLAPGTAIPTGAIAGVLQMAADEIERLQRELEHMTELKNAVNETLAGVVKERNELREKVRAGHEPVAIVHPTSGAHIDIDWVRRAYPVAEHTFLHQFIDRLAHEPPSECDGCNQYAAMHAEIAVTMGIHAATDAHHLQEVILGKLRAAQPPGAKCEWGYDAGDDVWHTGCGQMHVFMDRGPTENDHKFCPYCGKGIDDLSRPSLTKSEGRS